MALEEIRNHIEAENDLRACFNANFPNLKKDKKAKIVNDLKKKMIKPKSLKKASTKDIFDAVVGVRRV